MMRSEFRIRVAVFVVVNCLAAGIGLAHDPPESAPADENPASAILGAAPFQQKQTDGNAIGLVITNYGFFGNNFVTREPSMEYPLGTEIDHLIRAGLWIGAVNAEGDTVVSTGSISGYWGTGTATATEFTPQQKMRERSSLITSRSYSKDAISEQDFITEYTDYPLRGTNDNILQIRVRQRSYLWSYKFAEAFIIVSFTVINEGDGFLRHPCLGIFGELSSGWKGAYDTWRPSGSAWFRNKMLEWFPHVRMVGEHHYNYGAGTAPSWGAIAILGTEGGTPIDEVDVAFNWWDWYWERDNPMRDRQRYEFLANGEEDDIREIIPRETDPVELISAGPFPELAPGDSIVFVCAFLGGMDRASLLENADWALQAFENDYVLPSPPQPPQFRVEPARNTIKIFWDNYPEDKLDPFYGINDFEGYRIYITRVEGATSEEFELVREVDLVNQIGYDTGLESVMDTVTFDDGDTTTYYYNFEIDNVKDGFKYWVAITAFDRGIPEEGVESMQSGVRATRVLAIPGPRPATNDETVFVVPNPYRGEAIWDGARDREKYLWFVNLPERATIRIYTLAGDLVKTLEFDGSTYIAGDIQGLKTLDERHVAIPGGICGWDLISNKDQAAASGLYIYSIENKVTGNNQIGKFMIIR
jgi:hypothetical protein